MAKQILVPLHVLLENAVSTYATVAAAAAATTLTCKNLSGFDNDQVLLIGKLGGENSEQKFTHASTAVSGTTLTLKATTSLTRGHAKLTTIRVLPYDQVEYSHADTTDGAKSVLATQSFSTNTDNDVYSDSTASAGYYFWRFKNSLGSTFSAYSDPIPYAGKSASSAGYAIDYALRRNHTQRNNTITDTWLYEEINSCLRDITGKRKRWANLQSFDQILGQTTRGLNYYTTPTDLYDKNSNRSILDVRVGSSISLIYKDKKEWESLMYGTIETDVRTQGEIGDTTLAIDNSYDFADSGTIDYYISGTKYYATYTGITRSATAGVLTGVPASGDGSITIATPVDTRIYQGQSEGTPQYFTIYGGKLWIYPMPDGSNDDKNIYTDYWTEVEVVNSDGDTLDIARFDMVKDWLTWSIRAELNNDGKREMDDPDKQLYDIKLHNYMSTETTGQKFKMRPRINSIRP